MKQKIICDCCNKSVTKSHLNRHKGTKFCQMVKNKNNIIENETIDVAELKSQLLELQLKFEQLNL